LPALSAGDTCLRTVADQAPVPLEPFATLRAEIDAGEKLSEVIDREKISPETWAAAQAFWLKRMADEAGTARFETTTRYQTLYTAKKKVFEKKLKKQKDKAEAPPIVEPPVQLLARAEEKLDARPTSTVPSVPLAPPPVLVRPPPVPPLVAHSPMPAYAAPLPMAPPPAPIAALPISPAQPPMPPAIASPSAVPPRAGEPTLPLNPPGGVGRTMAVDIHELMAKMNQATPFKGDTVVPAEPRAPVASTDATPFRAAPPSPAPPPPAPSSPVPPPKKGADLGSTMIGLDAEQLLKKAFPFAAAAGQAVSPTQPDVRPPTMPPAMPFVERRAADETLAPATDPHPVAPHEPAHAASPLPFKQGVRSPDAAANKIFNINQFASLTAEIAERPENAADIRKRYGVSEAQHRAESERWTQEFAANAELRDRYFGSVQRYREYLKNRPG
jgi:hypothetical protein